MKKLILSGLLLIVSVNYVFSQSISEQKLNAICDTIKKQDSLYLGRKYKQRNLVSRYTFRNLVKNDFSTITVADNSATVGQFASLSIDPNTYKLAFSPYAWSPQGADLQNKKFTHVWSTNISTTLNNQSLFNLKDWRTVNGSISYTYVFNAKYKYAHDDGTTGEQKQNFIARTANDFVAPYIKIHDDLHLEMKELLKKGYTGKDPNELVALNHPEFKDEKDFTQAYLDSVSKYEQLFTGDSWQVKRLGWVKGTVSPLSFDNAYYIRSDDPGTFDAPKNKVQYTPSATVSGNYFIGTKTGWNFYWNANATISLKDMFSGIYTAQTYVNFTPLDNVSDLQPTNEQVFEITGAPLSPKWLPDLGAEFIIIKSFKAIAFGVDVNYLNNFVISNEPGISTGNISTIDLGLVIGLHDKNGKSTINIEPYWQNQDYLKVNLPSGQLWGVKFSLPINSLY